MIYDSYILYLLKTKVTRHSALNEIIETLERTTPNYIIKIQHFELMDKVEIITKHTDPELEKVIKKYIKTVDIPVKAIPDLEVDQHRMFKDWDTVGIDVKLPPETSTTKLLDLLEKLGSRVPIHIILIGKKGTIYGIYVETHKTMIDKVKESMKPLYQYKINPLRSFSVY